MVLRRFLLLGSGQLEIRYRSVPFCFPFSKTCKELELAVPGSEAQTTSSNFLYSSLKYSNKALYLQYISGDLYTHSFSLLIYAGQLRSGSNETASATASSTAVPL